MKHEVPWMLDNGINCTCQEEREKKDKAECHLPNTSEHLNCFHVVRNADCFHHHCCLVRTQCRQNKIKLKCERVAKGVEEKCYMHNLCTKKKIYSTRSCLFKGTALFIHKYLHSMEQHCIDLLLLWIHYILKTELFCYFPSFSGLSVAQACITSECKRLERPSLYVYNLLKQFHKPLLLVSLGKLYWNQNIFMITNIFRTLSYAALNYLVFTCVQTLWINRDTTACYPRAHR